MAFQRFELDPSAIESEIGSMSPNELDVLPFGAIQLDEEGVVLSYNSAEERLAGRTRGDVVGKNFFTEVAPCTKVKRFGGAFQAGVERRLLNEVFDFTFLFPEGKREVRIRMIYTASPKPAVWIFVTPL